MIMMMVMMMKIGIEKKKFFLQGELRMFTGDGGGSGADDDRY